MIPISIMIPVGPLPHHREWLAEAIQSVEVQAFPDDEIVLVNDGGPLLELSSHACRTQVYSLPANCGAVAANNIGVAIARNEHILMLGSDDRLLPGCLDALREAWLRIGDPLGYYYLAVEYADGRPSQNNPCQAAMVTKTLWRYTGGFPQEAALGAIDHIFLQMLITGRERGVSAARLYSVSDRVLYWYRPHAMTETNNKTQRWWGVIDRVVRDDLASKWLPQA